ncbi:MAG: CehA/McbA family metallohydrolase [Thermoplasmata archaeon]|nr:CehA/McbA family metallohydrolase [Thermoplasmata archaeon]
MRLDLHIHSGYSRDAANGSPRDVLKRAKAAGLDGLAITDHNAIDGSLEAESLAREFGLIVVAGVEVSTASGHVLVYGVKDLVPRGLSVEDTVSRIHELGGVAVAAHPRRFPSGIGLEMAMSGPFDGIETINGGNPAGSNAAARRIAESRGLSQTGGSDAHKPHEIGRSVTVLEDATTGDDVVDAIRRGTARSDGRSRTAREGMVYSYETLLEWVRGGFGRQ